MKVLPPDKGSFHLLLVGDGERRNQVAEAAKNRADVTWYPYVAEQNLLAELYSSADLFINPGTRETFGLVSVEAQACGTRVLGIRGGGMDETLEGEQPLVMAEEATAEALAGAIERLVDLEEDEEDRLKRRRRIEEKFSLKSTFDRLLTLYTHLKQGLPIDRWLSR
jgi:alpha-1,6-mannosyltransferase